MKRCAQCGRTYTDASLAFCLYDGQPLEAASAPGQATPSAPGMNAPPGTVPKPFPIGAVLGGVAVLLLLGLIGLDALGLTRLSGGSSQSTIVAAIQEADNAEIQADRTLDPSALPTYYTGDALAKLQSDVESLKGQGVYEDSDLESSQVQAVAFDGAGQNAAAQIIETWTSTFYNAQSNQIVETNPSQTIPQTIHLQRIGDRWMITRIDFNGLTVTPPASAPTP